MEKIHSTIITLKAHILMFSKPMVTEFMTGHELDQRTKEFKYFSSTRLVQSVVFFRDTTSYTASIRK